MSGGVSLRQLPSGAIQCENLANPFGNLALGGGYNALNKTSMLLLDRTTSGSTVSTAQHGEFFTLDTAGVSNEVGLKIFANATASTAGGPVRSKISVMGVIATSESTTGGNTSDCVGVLGVASANSTLVRIYGVQGTAQVPLTTTALSCGLSSVLDINNGAPSASFGAATSSYGTYTVSSGTTKPTSLSWVAKVGPGVNFQFGHVVESTAVDASAFAVNTGDTPLWAVQPSGKVSLGGTNLASPVAGAGPFAGAAASNITISLTGLVTVAQALSAAIVVNTTAVTAASIITARVISYGYGAAGAMAAGCPLVVLPGTIVAGTSFSFQIANVGTGALSGAIGIAFKIEN